MKWGRSADALGVGAAKLVVSLAVLAAGFRAVSDDDYARIVIAQRFAEAPRLDPSGTSWLPLPFWVYGGAFSVFGGSLSVARGVALLLGAFAMAALLVAARWLGIGRFGSIAGVMVAALFPWSAWLAAAPVPEVPAAALSVLAMAALSREEPSVRLWGAAAVAAACFCRYEAWPVAVAFALITLYDGYRLQQGAHRKAEKREGVVLGGQSRALVGAALLAVLPIGAWLLHGVFVHGDALFFWKRVAAYKNALGEGPTLGERFFSVPRSLLTGEPELALALMLVGVDRALLGRLARPALAAGALLVFLMVGELGGGGPTHHAGRAVLPVWYLVALALGGAIERRGDEPMARPWAWLGFALALVGLGWIFRAGTPPAFADRRDAVAIGTRARELGAPALWIDTPDYSYLAVTAAYGRPNAATPFDDRDPRHPRPDDPFVSEGLLRERAAARREAWLVVSKPHLAVATQLGKVRAETATLALVAPAPRALAGDP